MQKVKGPVLLVQEYRLGADLRFCAHWACRWSLWCMTELTDVTPDLQLPPQLQSTATAHGRYLSPHWG